MFNPNNESSGNSIIQQMHKFGGMKDNADDDDDEGDELLRANTLANEGNEGLEEESDISSHTGTETDATDATESVSTGMSDVEDDDDLDEMNELMDEEGDAPAETPAMLAKKQQPLHLPWRIPTPKRRQSLPINERLHHPNRPKEKPHCKT